MFCRDVDHHRFYPHFTNVLQISDGPDGGVRGAQTGYLEKLVDDLKGDNVV